jgi:hypothetical protein
MRHWSLQSAVAHRRASRSNSDQSDNTLGCSDNGVPIPKFATPCGTPLTNFGIRNDTSKFIIPVWLSDVKFLYECFAHTETI